MMSNKRGHGLVLQDEVKEVSYARLMYKVDLVIILHSSCFITLSHDLHDQLFHRQLTLFTVKSLTKLFSLDQSYFIDLQFNLQIQHAKWY